MAQPEWAPGEVSLRPRQLPSHRVLSDCRIQAFQSRAAGSTGHWVGRMPGAQAPRFRTPVSESGSVRTRTRVWLEGLLLAFLFSWKKQDASDFGAGNGFKMNLFSE